MDGKMTQSDKDFLYRTLNECVSALNEELSTGPRVVQVTIGRLRFNSLLKEIMEAKRVLIRPPKEKPVTHMLPTVRFK